MVVLDKQDFINKTLDLLAKGDTYRPLHLTQSTNIKNNLINILKPLRMKNWVGTLHVKDPIQLVHAPKILGATQIHKKDTP